MKTLTCRDMGGPCDEAFDAETMEEVAGMGGKHIMASTDDEHEPMRKMMAEAKPEDKEKWFGWFKGVWDSK